VLRSGGGGGGGAGAGEEGREEEVQVAQLPGMKRRPRNQQLAHAHGESGRRRQQQARGCLIIISSGGVISRGWCRAFQP